MAYLLDSPEPVSSLAGTGLMLPSTPPLWVPPSHLPPGYPDSRPGLGFGEDDLASRTSRFVSQRLRNMVAVGMTGPHWVRLWMRVESPGAYDVQFVDLPAGPRGLRVNIPPGAPGDNTAAVTYPQTSGDPPLTPLRRYRYRVTRVSDGALIGSGMFQASPAHGANAPESVTIGVMSCHQPFTNQGVVSTEAMRMLYLVPQILRENNVRFVLLCGDQIYSDYPGDLSLITNPHLVQRACSGKRDLRDCSPEQIRRALDLRYRIFWSMRPLQEMYANYPCYPAMDDHEIIDDWGSESAHSSPRYAPLRQGARLAYFDYQASRILPPLTQLPREFNYHFSYGDIGVYVMDIRSERTVTPRRQLCSEVQLNDLRLFLRDNGNKRALLIVCSVPVIHLPSWLANLGHRVTGPKVDFFDHWSYDGNTRFRDLFLSMLHEHQVTHPHQRVVLVSGDVHIGCAFTIAWRGAGRAGPRLYQFTSSPITNLLRGWRADLSAVGPQLVSGIGCPQTRFGRNCSGEVRLLPGVSGAAANPLIGLNLGLIEIRRYGGESNMKFKLLGYSSHAPLTPVTRFESGWLN